MIWKLVFLVSMFEGVTFVLGLEILVSSCIFMIFKDLLICDKKIKSVVHDMKIGLFLVDLNSQIDPGTRIFGQTFGIFLTCNKIPIDAKTMWASGLWHKTGLFSR